MRIKILLIAVFCIMIACSSPISAPAPTASPAPTFTSTFVPTTTPSPVPSLTATPVPTATPAFPASKLGTSQLDVTYCTPDGLPQQMDVYYPASGGPWPVVVYVHGGSWYGGDKADGAPWASLTATGYLVVSVNYRLGTAQIKFPAMIEDVKCAVRHLRAHAAEYNLNPARIGAIGTSAGGHLVALLGTTDPSAGWDGGEYSGESSRVQAVVVLSGVSDLTLSVHSGLNNAIFSVFGQISGIASSNMIAASPVTYITSDDPPFLVVHGNKDGLVPVEQGTVLAARLEAAGVPSTLVIVYGGDHGLHGLNGAATVPTPEQIAQVIQRFLDQYLK